MEVFVGFVVAGLVLQAASHLWPVRRFRDRPEYLLDAFALLVAAVTQIAIATVGFAWVEEARAVPAVEAVRAGVAALPGPVAALGYFVVLDFLAYWLHRLNHARWLWATHAFHHSSTNVNWASGMRGSPVHFLLLGIPGLAVQVFHTPEGGLLTALLFYGVVHNSLIHSNVRIPTRLLNAVFVTGRSHLVHHARDTRLGNSNFGFLFTVWDRLFGTWVDPGTIEKDHALGLDYEVGSARLVVGLPAARGR